VCYRTPDEDLAFWFGNLRGALEGLEAMPASANGMERTNTLMKLRETLLDTTTKGTVVTSPPGVSKFPHNLSYLVAEIVTGIVAIIGLAYLWLAADMAGLPRVSKWEMH
jgi:hypothetical protein